jgi:hypothetical protein
MALLDRPFSQVILNERPFGMKLKILLIRKQQEELELTLSSALLSKMVKYIVMG